MAHENPSSIEMGRRDFLKLGGYTWLCIAFSGVLNGAEPSKVMCGGQVMWLQILGPSLLMALGGLITWFIKSRIEELRAIEEKLRDTRREVYGKILEPYIALFADIKGQGQAKAAQKLASEEYRKAAFDLSLFGSDSVVRAYNALMSHVFEAERKGQQDSRELMGRWGGLLLEIRRSLGNKRTKLHEIEMLRGMVKDIDSALLPESRRR